MDFRGLFSQKVLNKIIEAIIKIKIFKEQYFKQNGNGKLYAINEV